jgi:hypothetical protein
MATNPVRTDRTEADIEELKDTIKELQQALDLAEMHAANLRRSERIRRRAWPLPPTLGGKCAVLPPDETAD